MTQRANALEPGMGKPVCSICIANYNGVGVIEDCLDSVFAQDCDIPFEVIVHDDASGDGSAQHIRTVYPQVVLIESADNVGFCIANNRMVERATGEFILLLNNDAALYPDALATLLKGAQDIGQPAILTLASVRCSEWRVARYRLSVRPLSQPGSKPGPGTERSGNGHRCLPMDSEGAVAGARRISGMVRFHR